MSARPPIQAEKEFESLRNPILGPRLLESVRATLDIEGHTALEVFGSPDDMKLRGSATLFAHVSLADSVFEQLLDRYFAARPDSETLRLLAALAVNAAAGPPVRLKGEHRRGFTDDD